jgi:hypothetical protein
MIVHCMNAVGHSVNNDRKIFPDLALIERVLKPGEQEGVRFARAQEEWQ